MDMLLAAVEHVSITLLSIALQAEGMAALGSWKWALNGANADCTTTMLGPLPRAPKRRQSAAGAKRAGQTQHWRSRDHGATWSCRPGV